MLMLIIFVILAILALVFLISFNMRASSKQQKNNPGETQTQTATIGTKDSAKVATAMMETPVEKPASNTTSDADKEPSVERSVEFTHMHTDNENRAVSSQDKQSHSEAPVVANEIRNITKNTNKMMDQEYRNALKQFQAPSKKEKDKTSESAAKYIKDTEYRDALRSMYKPKEPNRSVDQEK